MFLSCPHSPLDCSTQYNELAASILDMERGAGLGRCWHLTRLSYMHRLRLRLQPLQCQILGRKC